MTGLNQIAAVFLSVGLISAFYCPVPASAQEATSAEESAEAAGERREIEEIVVTARRREESLQAVPLSVTLFDEDALGDEIGVMDETDKPSEVEAPEGDLFKGLPEGDEDSPEGESGDGEEKKKVDPFANTELDD